MAKVTLPPIAIPRIIRCLILVRASPPNQVLGDGAPGVLGPHKPVYLVAIEAAGVCAASRLEVVRHPRGRGKQLFAKRALDILAPMNPRIEVLEIPRAPVSMFMAPPN